MTLLEIYWAFFKFGLLCFRRRIHARAAAFGRAGRDGAERPLTPEGVCEPRFDRAGHAGADRDQYGDLCRLHAAGDPGGLPRHARDCDPGGVPGDSCGQASEAL